MEKRIWHQHYEDGVPAELEFQGRNLLDFLTDSVSTYPTRPALTFLNGTLTYRQFQDEVKRLATALAVLGVETPPLYGMTSEQVADQSKNSE